MGGASGFGARPCRDVRSRVASARPTGLRAAQRSTEYAGLAGAGPDQLETIEVKSAVETLDPTKVKLTVEVTYDELKPSIAHAYEHIAQDVTVPGFRKGKV